MEITTLCISLVALLISLGTFWISIKPGAIKMTRPTLICFAQKSGEDNSKIFVRTLLYCTAQKGRHIQNMYCRLIKNKDVREFDSWAYKIEDKLVKGSGLYVDRSGVSAYHHFLLLKEDKSYDFQPGDYTLQVFIECVGEQPKVLWECNFTIPQYTLKGFTTLKAIYFEWLTGINTFVARIENDGFYFA
jgi:hypothetical protein